MEPPLTNERPARACAELGAERTPPKQRQRQEAVPRSKGWRRGAAGSTKKAVRLSLKHHSGLFAHSTHVCGPIPACNHMHAHTCNPIPLHSSARAKTRAASSAAPQAGGDGPRRALPRMKGSGQPWQRLRRSVRALPRSLQVVGPAARLTEEDEEFPSRKPQTRQEPAGESQHVWVPRRKCSPSV